MARTGGQDRTRRLVRFRVSVMDRTGLVGLDGTRTDGTWHIRTGLDRTRGPAGAGDAGLATLGL
jgi:hypothetical protein